jgi:hypothetical protein
VSQADFRKFYLDRLSSSGPVLLPLFKGGRNQQFDSLSLWEKGGHDNTCYNSQFKVADDLNSILSDWV